MDLPGYHVEELGKVAWMIDGRRQSLGAAGTTNTPAGTVCPICKKKARGRNSAWLFWPLVGLVCVDCSRDVQDATPWEPLELRPNGTVQTSLTRVDNL